MTPRLAPALAEWLQRFGAVGALRWGLLAATSLVCALLLPGLSWVPTEPPQAGEVAQREVRAAASFEYVDREGTENARSSAAKAVAPVWEYDVTLGSRLQGRISTAFDIARRRLAEATVGRQGKGPVPDEVLAEIGSDFLRHLNLSLTAEDLLAIQEAEYGTPVEEVANALVGHAMRGFVVGDRSQLPSSGPLSVIYLHNGYQEEQSLQDVERLRTPDEARQAMYLHALETFEEEADPLTVRAGLGLAKAAVRANLSPNQLVTGERRQKAAGGVGEVRVAVPRGTTLVRVGDVVTSRQQALLEALAQKRADRGPGATLGVLFLFCSLLLGALYRFGRSTLGELPDSPRDLLTLAGLLMLVVGSARVVVDLSNVLPGLGAGASPESVWYLVPVAGAVLLVRVLMNATTALVFAVGAAVLCGLVMEGEARFPVYFTVTSLTAAGALAGDRTRRAILRTGLTTGLVGAAMALLVGLVQVTLLDRPMAPAQPLWDALFALLGGLVSAFLVLALVPLFELVGYVTDLQLLELANLNHPLLRNLMLRAPGTYHHSVMVGQLAEAASEAVGANALQARVASYFHDIGKAVTPQYFVENQSPGHNRHDRMDPRSSARIIIDHVRNGAAIARRHRLPAPIVEAITTHHGTSLLHLFYRSARTLDPNVSEAEFRYPGPKPDTREAGIIHLADKVEAACRSIRHPTPERYGEMIQKLVNSSLADGQLDECPLTLKELYVIARVFRETLVAVNHQRISYPDTAELPEPARTPSRDPVITLEFPAEELRSALAGGQGELFPEGSGAEGDYESADALPVDPLLEPSAPDWQESSPERP